MLTLTLDGRSLGPYEDWALITAMVVGHRIGVLVAAVVGFGAREALGRGDLASAERYAHSMMSAAGMIGAVALAASAKDLQDRLRAGAGGSVEPVLVRFESAFEGAVRDLRALALELTAR